MPPKTTWTDDEKKAHSEKSMRARIEAAAAHKGCTAEELAAMPETELLKLRNLGRKTVDFLLRAKRDVAAAKAFFRRAFMRQGRLPQKITLDGYQASHRAAKEALDEHPEGNQWGLPHFSCWLV